MVLKFFNYWPACTGDLMPVTRKFRPCTLNHTFLHTLPQSTHTTDVSHLINKILLMFIK